MSKVLLVYDDFAELSNLDSALKKVGFDVIALTNEYTIKDQVVTFNPDVIVICGDSSRVSTLSVGKKLKEMSRWQGKSILVFPPTYKIPPDDLLKIRMDMMLETRISLTKMIQVIAKYAGQDENLVVDRLVKPFSNEKADISSSKSEPVKLGDDDNKIQIIQGKENKKEDPFQELIKELSGADKEIEIVKDKNKLNKETVEIKSAESAQERLRNEVEAHSQKMAEKLKKYSEILTESSLYPESTLKKVATKAEFKKLMKDWNKDELKDQDGLRKEFVKALFKK
ncbi:MAG: hypothetical protein L6Q37_10100 [Bdellovibrionaceae bacterium]|nr:hypothetical protein [Pseudobdellovibrionaceae bacterium]NUM57891.1 hypothetical protein [Pseudobdellovibrionaceae bacterium]